MGLAAKERGHGAHHAGLDVSLKTTAICVVDNAGKIIHEGMVASDPRSHRNFHCFPRPRRCAYRASREHRKLSEAACPGSGPPLFIPAHRCL